MKKKFMCMLMAAAMPLSMAACGSKGDDANNDANAGGSSDGVQTFTVGTSGPLTGDNAIYGVAVKQGVELAINEINASDSTIKFEFLSQDDEADGEKAVNAYNNMMDNGMQVLVGPTTTGASIAVADACYTDRTFMLTPSASSTDVTAGKDNVFQVCFTDPNQGKAAADYIKEHQLGTKIAAIYNNGDAYSTGIFNAFQAEAQEIGLEIVSASTFPDDTNADFTVQLGEAQKAGADLVFMPIYYTPASLILNQAKTMGYEPTFFGCDGMDGILDLEGFDTSLAEGLMLMTPFNAWGEDERTVKFVNEYQALAGGIPNQFAADGYDCVYAIYEACQQAGVTADMGPQEVCEKLTKVFTDGSFAVDGLTGTGMHWQTNGEVSKDPVVVKVESGKYVTQ